MLTQILYTSRSTYPRGNLTDLEILRTAMRSNENDGITGALLRDHRRFFQILEGEQETVLSLVRRIQQDRRHFDMSILVQRSIQDRTFGEWSTGDGEIDVGTIGALESINLARTDALDMILATVLPFVETPAL